MWDKKLNTQESRRTLYLFTVRQAEGDSQTSLHPQESSCLAAAPMQHIASHQYRTQRHLLGPVGLFVFQSKQQITSFLFLLFTICHCLCIRARHVY